MVSRLSLRHIALAMAFAHTGWAQLNPLSYIGCYSSSSGLTQTDTDQYQSDGLCQGVCVGKQQAVLGLTAGNACLCGSETPPSSAKVDDSKCNTPCTGYGQHMCGGTGFYSVYLTGTSDSVSSVGGGTATSGNTKGPSSSTSAPSVITSIAPGQTVVITQSANAAAGASQSPASAAPAKTNTTAIAVGAVVGVLALAAIGGLIFFFRYRRRRRAEAEYQQSQAGDFMAGGKPQIPARRPSGPDSRFDAEAMAHRRMSDGSIADNEDYSRRILKVTNPDDR